MSKHFYNYLAERIKRFFNDTNIQPGEKYHIQFERTEQVENLVAEVKALDEAEPFYMQTEEDLYQSVCLVAPEAKILVAANSDEVTPDFLTTLRNKVGTQENPFMDKAMLLIHNSNLDSLVQGMTSFGKEGMPFHINSIEENLQEMMSSSELSQAEKQILKFSMAANKAQQGIHEQITLFDYEKILTVLNNQKLEDKDYKDFALFRDTDIFNTPMTDKQIQARLSENQVLFSHVEMAHQYGPIDISLERHFDEQGVKELSAMDWQSTDFGKVMRSNQKKLEGKGLEYIEPIKKLTLEGLTYWERPDGETKSKQRKRNLIIFNPEQHRRITLELPFSDFIKNQFISNTTIKYNINSEASGKKIKVELTHSPGQTNFYGVKYKTDVSQTYDFKIAIIETEEKLLQAIQTSYTVNLVKSRSKHSSILINSDDEQWIFNKDQPDVIKVELMEEFEQNQFEIAETDELVVTKNPDMASEEELIHFTIKLVKTEIPLSIQDVVDRPVPIGGFNVWKMKREKQEHFIYRLENDKMKIIQGTRETYAQGEFKKNLERELKLIEANHLHFTEEVGILNPEPINVPEPVKEAYIDLLRYFRDNQLLPSLAYFDEDYATLAKRYVQAYLQELEQLQNGQSLLPSHREMVLLGTIRKGLKDPEWLYTPLHPLNLAYQLQLNDLIGKEAINDELLRSLRPTHLLPYVHYNNALYKAIEPSDSYEWTTYIDQGLPRFESSKMFVNKLVQEKIEEFTEHFSYLFELDYRAPLKINTINMGDCQEILQGLFEYYKRQLKREIEKSDLLPIELHIYAEKGINNVFEEMSQYSDAEEIAKNFNLKLELEGYHSEELLNIFRDQVKFYSRDVEANQYEYSHVTFYQMSKIEQEATSNAAEMITGVSLFGLVSGIPSVFINEDYKTGFGTKYYRTSDAPLLALVPKLNSLLRVARTLDNYQEDMNIVTAISAEHKQKLDAVYDSAHWVTFIEPKVDLSFFKNNDAQKDLLVIHYSDQYTSSSGFDAITVTRRSQQYQKLIKEFLHSHEIKATDEVLPPIINFFNAINGNWLLRLLAQKNQFPREKISILSAVKLALAAFAHKDIIWIPISMEEILRISGGTGLRQSEGLFSARNLGRFGSYSDDLLLIGIEQQEQDVKVHFYPIEVKIGHNSPAVYEKAMAQVKETRQLLFDFLTESEEDPFKAKLYRNFFMQLAIASAEKMDLYSIWPEQYWQNVTDSSLREKLLNDDYTISNNLQEYIGDGAVISFKKELVFTEIKRTEDVLVFDYPEKSGYDFIIKDIEEIKNHIQSEYGDIPADQLLSKLYIGGEEEVVALPNPVESSIQSFDRIDVPQLVAENSTGYEPDQREQVNIAISGNSEDSMHEVQQEKQEQPVAAEPRKPLEILFGHNAQNQEEIKWYPTSTDKVMHTNTGIIGTMGTGKTQFTKSLITQLSRSSQDNVNGTKIGILIFDYKGDYIKPDFTEKTGAKVYDLYHLPYNPLSLYVTKPIRPLLPVHTSGSLTDTIAKSFNLGQVQVNTLKGVIMDAYNQQGILKNDPTTWEQPAPTLSDVYDIYAGREDAKVDSLYAALQELYEMEVFEPDANKTIPLFDMIDGITVINLSGFNASIQNLVVSITLDVFYNQMQMQGHSAINVNYREITKMILVDEADNFLSKDFTSIKKILKEGREYGVGTILSTQFLSHFSTSDNDYANYILTWIVHNVSEMSAKEIRMVFSTQSKAEEDNVMNRIKSLKKHYSIVKAGAGQPVWMRDRAFWELNI
ncbi:DNA phosphorothioation-dependent restriction protein DptH [Saccharibacillus sp. CPCC 101409]|uniref:DNA phosphorothioation-dependent restriction protein DptH n=1 Tax=Saccharibacillus sp. CPCC 101409 TaxID=3058041 RepID=UPI002672361E|nr:DNA phosphorothioation-dependent restriction protein DptH [Saccharibacillus sp. CPCC 101409]MDO3408381.1 DNA phosphorothioation-dependent restriction protein DptH [Saccharibacillus sp. CPCC 101409]